MDTKRKVATIVGSIRQGSFNRKMAHAAIGLAPESLELSILEIVQLPFFNQDHEADPPQVVTDFKQRIAESDAVFFVTPEYNRGVPGVLKNAIDVASRPYGKSAWNGKPAAVISVSTGQIGGFGANHHLRQSMVFLNMPSMPQPEAYIGYAAKLFDDKGTLVDESTRGFLRKFMEAFAMWIEANAPREGR